MDNEITCGCLPTLTFLPKEDFILITLIIFILLYGRVYLKNSNKYEKVIGAISLLVVVTLFNWYPIKEFYRENFSITRYPSDNGHGFYKSEEGIFNDIVSDDKINEADLESFVGLNAIYAKDKNNVYFMDKILKNADSSTFEVIKTNDTYTKRVSKEHILVVNEIHKGGYAKDKNNSYFYGKIITGSDPDTFQVTGSGYSKDKNNVYFEQEKIKDIDPNNYNEIGDYYISGKDTIYYKQVQVKSPDIDSFFVIGSGYAQDKDNKYFKGYKIKPLDSKTYVDIGNGYSKDKNNVYYNGAWVEMADPNDFYVTGSGSGQGRNGYFRGTKYYEY